jgi:hypothetical protein
MEDDIISPERKFLHDIATPMSVLKLLLIRIKTMTQEELNEKNVQKLTELTQKCINSVEKMEAFHADAKLRLANTKDK